MTENNLYNVYIHFNNCDSESMIQAILMGGTNPFKRRKN